MTKKLDAIDKRILDILQAQGRISNAALSQAINLSPTPCLDRVRRLEREGYIKGYHAVLSPEHLKCAFVTFITVSLDRTTEYVFDSFAKKIAKFDEVVECYMVGGGFDYLLKIRTEDMTEFRRFMGEKLTIMPEVANTQSFFVMEEVKDTHLLQVIKPGLGTLGPN
ncbi:MULTISPECIES: Lrp/AsnC ligand binding domain-containing protein [Kordiimonas]|jgi:Lrp/AsnC family leucine-responsive transcriptional regulator|uniref:Lrp/AsnC family transcriptional regulator, leucine-responsive regulatory protein n=1 Tax=Kordiimonas lacus TaxID=637679 RepID=A0A1G6VD25_9PROT|nr:MULTISPECIES: Lrp/AsnC ligand binding domain-containing protein [Kordiimonas]SDD51610.1 Lrp/AsnC family transcriptional regulator, leucine-responsive regulatory protein [Kordiimonas lacus]